MKPNLVRTTLGHQCRKTESFDRQIFGVLEAEDRGNVQFLSEPRNIFNAWVLADEKSRENFTDLRLPRTAVMRRMRRKGVVKARHVGNVEKARKRVKIQPSG